MIFSVSDAQKRAGEPFPIAWEGELDPQSYAGRTVAFDGPAKLNGTMVYDGKAISVRAEATAAYRTECARCTRTFIETVSFRIEERFVRDTMLPDDEDAYPYTSEQIDMERPFYDNLLLSLPLVSVCKPDCKGLCPICGTDRNRKMCACQTETSGGPFGALQQLLNENKEV